MTIKVPVGWKALNTYKFVDLVLGGFDRGKSSPSKEPVPQAFWFFGGLYKMDNFGILSRYNQLTYFKELKTLNIP